MMNGDSDLPQRSSSPLKRRASSMDPEPDSHDKDALENNTDMAQTLPRAMSLDPLETTQTEMINGLSGKAPPIHEQVKIIETLLLAFKDAPLKEGDEAYLVSRSWVDQALAYGSGSKQRQNLEAEALGPVDNADIVESIFKDSSGYEFARLRPGYGLESFELFPEDAWNMVVDWCGLKAGQQPIIRVAINDAPDAQSKPNIIYELHPPVFRIHRLWSELSPFPIEQALKADNPPPIVLVRSRKTAAQVFLKEVKTLTGIPHERKVRMFSIPQRLPAHSQQNIPNGTGGDPDTGLVIVNGIESADTLTPPDSPQRGNPVKAESDHWPFLLVDTPAFSAVRDLRIEVPISDQTNNDKYNGKSTIQVWDLVTDQVLVLDEAIDDGWVSTYTKQKATKIIPKTNSSAFNSRHSSRHSSPSSQPTKGRGRALRKTPGKSLGAVGLHNLGNTCYMNSALQCVRSVEELTKYFLTDTYIDEINKTNPLGYNGRVAMAYMGLLKEIYHEGRGSVSPRDFKTTVGRCRSTFQGWGQQDSQEFLGFLLDGLQEDLSRIKKKPYIEKPDSTDDMIDDPKAIRQMAEQVWDITRRRDDSVIADLFTGMYKSTLKCPECGKISITFDPFNNLTLPLPVENMWMHTVKFFPLNDAPVKIEVELPKHSAIELLKQFVSERTGVPTNRLIGAEEFKDRFFKIYQNQQDVSEEISGSDHPTMHELEMVPTNWPSKEKVRKYRSMLDIDCPPGGQEWDDPRYESMVVPVFHRRSAGSGPGRDGVAPPHFITLTRKEAFDLDRIKRKVLEKVSTLSNWPALGEEAETVPSKSADPDTVVILSDADSFADSRVADLSVADEEDMVDVTMKDVADNPAHQHPTLDTVSTPLKHFNTTRPAFIDSKRFLNPKLQNLFELSYFRDGSDGSVPSGWSQVEQNRLLPKVADRLPQSEVEDEEDEEEEDQAEEEDEVEKKMTAGTWTSTTPDKDEIGNDKTLNSDNPPTRMLDESSEEDISPPRAARRTGGHFNGSKKKLSDHRPRNKKFNKRREKSLRSREGTRTFATVKPQPLPQPVADGGPLLRLGEGLVVDWNEDAWDAVFGQSVFESLQSDGSKKWTDVETLHDHALNAIKRRRQTRKSRGITLDECLDEFERAEVLSEQDMWYCPRCKEHRRASKKFDLWKSPDILVAHLKRFSSSGYRRDKLDVLVDFPIENLDMTSRVIEKDTTRGEIYDLIAVDDHYGGLGGGHYTAYAKNFVDGRWYNYNDSSVHQVSDLSGMVTSAAYLLFYRRRAKGPLGGARFTEICHKYDKSELSDGDSDTEIGDDNESNEVYNQSGLISLEERPATFRTRSDRESTTTTITPLTNSDVDAEDNPDLPSYHGFNSFGDSIQPSVEDEGVEMAESSHNSESNPVAQGWSFSGLTNHTRQSSNGDDCASDKVHPDLTDTEQGSQAPAARQPTITTGDDMSVEYEQERGQSNVVPLVSTDRDITEVDDVTEIHVEGDRHFVEGWETNKAIRK